MEKVEIIFTGDKTNFLKKSGKTNNLWASNAIL